uniref:Uncharacterized protein n=1 Tax=Ciona intestinalis TaxID=7719 RepID=H2Y006_CIOIN
KEEKWSILVLFVYFFLYTSLNIEFLFNSHSFKFQSVIPYSYNLLKHLPFHKYLVMHTIVRVLHLVYYYAEETVHAVHAWRREPYYLFYLENLIVLNMKT